MESGACFTVSALSGQEAVGRREVEARTSSEGSVSSGCDVDFDEPFDGAGDERGGDGGGGGASGQR